MLTGDIKKIGFVGAGGALGLLVGVILSAFIHNDHVAESISAWIVALPLMYGLSKIACHIAGCCHGIPYSGTFSVTYEVYNNTPYFPVQLTETAVFIIIFVIALFSYLKMENKLKVATIVLLASGGAKFILDYLRESHGEKAITGYQILVLIITLSGAILIQLFRHPKSTDENQE
jgi:prolipoprotein diacylglyceryltransferase